jgi:hypothetical protein
MPRAIDPPGGWDSPDAAFQILDGETRTCYWPPLLRALYECSRPWVAPPQPVHPTVPDVLARLARTGADRLARMVVGAAPERPLPSTPDCDGLAAQVIREVLHKRGVSLDLDRTRPSAPVSAPIDGPVIVIGGPGSQWLSEAINQALARRDWGIRGFYFAPAGEAPDRLGNLVRCWRLRAHGLPEALGIPDPDDPYARLPDGRKADVGMLYLGANPLARQHGLIWVAGLGSVGTVGAALALQDGRVMEAIARGVTDEQTYMCALVRYRFADEQCPLDGALACMALIRGVLRSP